MFFLLILVSSDSFVKNVVILIKAQFYDNNTFILHSCQIFREMDSLWHFSKME